MSKSHDFKLETSAGEVEIVISICCANFEQQRFRCQRSFRWVNKNEDEHPMVRDLPVFDRQGQSLITRQPISGRFAVVLNSFVNILHWHQTCIQTGRRRDPALARTDSKQTLAGQLFWAAAAIVAVAHFHNVGQHKMTHEANSSGSLWLDPWQIAWRLRAFTTLTVLASTMASSLFAEDLVKSTSSSDFIGHFRVKQAQPANVRMPGDFEVHHDLVLAVGDSSESFLKTITAISEEVAGRIRVVVLLNSEFDFERLNKSFEKAGCEMSNVSFVHATCDTRWIRDYGPTCVDNGTNSKWIDWLYDPERPNDDEMPDTFLSQSGALIKFVPLEVEGGNLLSNGHGIVLTSSEVFAENPTTYTQKDAILEIATTLNASDVVVLQPLAGEDTGHVDMFAAFVNSETVFVGYYREEDDPVNAAILDRNAAILAGVSTASGNKLRVVRIPMDRNKDNVWRTYTNCIFANGVVLVPTYRSGSKQIAQKAMKLYEQYLPDWKVVAVDASELIECGGALRCASLGLFRTKKRFRSIDPAKMPPLPISIQLNERELARRRH